jgi:hypothetical protein
MRKIILVISIFLILISSVYSQKILSENSQISILTCSPGHELYSTFGHSAVRIVDENNNFDWVFNYGTFNFNTPNFYGKFIKGRLDYQLTIEEFKNFKYFYNKDKRDVYEQVLDLSLTEKQQIFDFLMWNAKEENKYYLYDFFWDNCATRIRDIFIDLYADTLVFPERNWNISFRDMIDYYLDDTPWTHFGINLVLGLPADSIVDNYYVQFLPDYMDTVFQSTIIQKDTSYSIVKERNQIISAQVKDEIGLKRYFSPTYVFWGLFLIIGLVTFFEFKNKKRFYGIDAFLLFLFGFIGIFIAFLWFGTEHRGANYNLNIIWALPIHFIAAIILLFNKKSNFINKYLFVTGIYTLIFLPFWNIFPQRLDTSLIPLFMTVGLRFSILFISKKKQ